VIPNVKHNAAIDDDAMVEVAIPAESLSPDCIADVGLVRQGGLRRLLPWLFGG
jgi:hypothetical protein